MSFSFRYRPVTLDSGQIIRRPIIPLQLEGVKRKIGIFGYLDSGSDISVMSREIADIIGIDFIDEMELYGITGDSMKVDIGFVNVIIGKGHEEYNFKIPILISQKEWGQFIIGRKGFFEEFKIIFIEAEKKITFKKFKSKI